MFVENERVFNFRPVGNRTLEEIKEECFNNFLYKLKNYVMQPGNPHPKIITRGLHQYNHFENEFGENISYNTKNREFYKLYTDLKDFVKDNMYPERVCKEDQEVEPQGTHYILSQNGKEFIKIKVDLEDNPDESSFVCNGIPSTTFYMDDFIDLFSRGEFPFMGISIVRIGNHDYYFYTITR